ncbi:histidine permease [Pseudogymnoascus australis]
MPNSHSLHTLHSHQSHHDYPEEFSSPSRLTSNSLGYYDSSTHLSSGKPWYSVDRHRHLSLSQRFVDSFKRDPNRRSTNPDINSTGRNGALDPHMAVLATANTSLARKLKGRHLQMIAIGGSVGTGLFVASGRMLHEGGPASVLIAFSLIGCLLFCTVHALGEMAVLYPVAGSFSAYSTRFLDPAWGFAMGWAYATQWLIVLPLEIVAASVTISYWNNTLPRSIFVTIFLVLIIFINLFGVKGYGEAEFVFSLVKVVAVIGFIILGIIINCAGNPHGGYIGGKFWVDPGPFNNGFKGLCSVFVTAAFAFAGTELIGLASAETANPRKSLPTAIKQVFWRITLFYIVSLTIVGLLVANDDKRLLNEGTANANASASPFVIAIEDAGITVLPSVMNAVILIAILSVGNSAVFGSTRTLAALADQGHAPKILGYVDRKGRPIVAIALASTVGLIAYATESGQQGTVLSWMLSFSGLSSIFTWGSICLSHIRFRRAWELQGHSLDELAFVSQPGLAGSWVGFIFTVLVLAAQFWTGAWPIDYRKIGIKGQMKSFFVAYLTAIIVLVLYGGYKYRYKTKVWRARDMDLRTGRRELNLDKLLKAEREEKEEWPRWKRWYDL